MAKGEKSRRAWKFACSDPSRTKHFLAEMPQDGQDW